MLDFAYLHAYMPSAHVSNVYLENNIKLHPGKKGKIPMESSSIALNAFLQVFWDIKPLI